MQSSDFRFAVVISHPIQHYSPLFRALAEVAGIHVKVFYLCDHLVRESYDPGFGVSFSWDVPLLDGYEYEFLRTGFSPRRFGFFETDSPLLCSRLDDFQPHVVWIHGYGQRISWRALNWARKKAAVIYFGDSELLHKRNIFSRVMKSLPLRYFFGRCDAIMTIGDNNEKYYLHYGVSPAKLFRGACPVDVERFQKALNTEGRMSREDMRKRFNIPGGFPVVVTVGKLEARKRPLDLVEAIALLKRRGTDVCALFIGEGTLRHAIEERLKYLGLENNIRITGFVNQSEMPCVIETGDMIAMMSDYDPHPLAVTEGMIIGLPVVVSDKIGCVGPTDTARPGVNALVYPCGDVQALAGSIEALVADGKLRKRMGEASSLIAPTQDVDSVVRVVTGMLSSLRERFAERWPDVKGAK